MPKIKQHIPILVQPILDAMPSDAILCIDGTVGHGGHMSAMCRHHEKENARFVGFDKTASNLTVAFKLNNCQ